jgi:hypothetical protein
VRLGLRAGLAFARLAVFFWASCSQAQWDFEALSNWTCFVKMPSSLNRSLCSILGMNLGLERRVLVQLTC